MNQHQRDLKTNELEKLFASAAPHFEKHKETIIYAICAGMLAFSAWYYLSKTSSTTQMAGWSKLIVANGVEEFGTIASQHQGEVTGYWALLNEAEILLNQGVRGSFVDREGAVSDLKAAEEKFREILNSNELPEPLEERALLGLARALETMSGEETAKAIEAYEQFQSRFPNSIYNEVVATQITALGETEGKEFYAWFHEQDPKPADPAKPMDGLPPGHPSVDPGSLITLPDTPSMLRLPESSAPAFPEGVEEETGGVPDPPPVPEDGDQPTPGTAPALPETVDPGTTPPEKSDDE